MSLGLALGVAAAGLGGAALYYGAPYAMRRRQVRSLAERARRDRVAVLTYDDGPGPRLTPALLELLAAHGARATFFALGSRAVAAPGLVDRVRGAGHEVACHAYQHVSAWRSIPGSALRDARRGFDAMGRWIDGAGWFRPPHGKIDLATWLWLRARGTRPVWWTLDSGDTWEPRPSPGRAAEQLVASGGGVVLLHDFDGTPERDEFVLAATRALLEAAQRNGIRVRTLGDWLGEAAH